MNIILYAAIPSFFSHFCSSMFAFIGLENNMTRILFLFSFFSSQISKILGPIISTNVLGKDGVRKSLIINPIIIGLTTVIIGINAYLNINSNAIVIICRLLQGIGMSFEYPQILFVIKDNTINTDQADKVISKSAAAVSIGHIFASYLGPKGINIYIFSGILCILSCFFRYTQDKQFLFRQNNKSIVFKSINTQEIINTLILISPGSLISYIFNIWHRLKEKQEQTELYILQKYTFANILEFIIRIGFTDYIINFITKQKKVYTIILLTIITPMIFLNGFIIPSLSYTIMSLIIKTFTSKMIYLSKDIQTKSFIFHIATIIFSILSIYIPENIFKYYGYTGLCILIIGTIISGLNISIKNN